ncbi:MAG: hypothetical protein NDI69_14890 [Bacteriovoracaceae bacterium]|nr:hypothetical protein [Bacteriovoracaceae bacterium]
MEIRSLNTIKLEVLYQTFQEAFEHYDPPIHFHQESDLLRWKIAGVDLEISYGAFDQDKLVAFVLHASYGQLLYNFATGVIPSYRGQHLIEKIYSGIREEHRLPLKVSLEVNQNNERALHLYKTLGFQMERSLMALKGRLKLPPLKKEVSYQVQNLIFTEDMRQISLYRSGVECSCEALLKHPEFHECHFLIKEGELVAYAIYTPLLNLIRGIGAQAPIFDHLDLLLLEMKMNGEDLRIMNIDSSSKELISYLKHRGQEIFISQYEMTSQFFLQVPR